MLRPVVLYVGTLTAFLIIDLLWLGVVARSFYADQMGSLLRADVRWGAAFLFYLIYVGGILVLAVAPALEQGSLQRAALQGALLGLVAYAAYDLTNLATLEGFPTRVAWVDLAWGTALTASVAAVGYWIGRALPPGL
jgi:uncharacterized membrane protein